MDDWIQRNQEESYLGHLEQLLVQRLQNQGDEDLMEPPNPRSVTSLNQLSIEMNQELERLEKLIAEELANSTRSGSEAGRNGA